MYELVIALLILSLLTVVAARLYPYARTVVTLRTAQTEMAEFQKFALWHFHEFGEVPATEEVYRRYLRSAKVHDLVLVKSDGYILYPTPLFHELGLHIVPRPQLFVVYSKRSYQPFAALLYAVDDRKPIAYKPE